MKGICEGGPSYIALVVDGQIQTIRVNSDPQVWIDNVKQMTGKEPEVVPATMAEYKAWHFEERGQR